MRWRPFVCGSLDSTACPPSPRPTHLHGIEPHVSAEVLVVHHTHVDSKEHKQRPKWKAVVRQQQRHCRLHLRSLKGGAGCGITLPCSEVSAQLQPMRTDRAPARGITPHHGGLQQWIPASCVCISRRCLLRAAGGEQW